MLYDYYKQYIIQQLKSLSESKGNELKMIVNGLYNLGYIPQKFGDGIISNINENDKLIYESYV